MLKQVGILVTLSFNFSLHCQSQFVYFDKLYDFGNGDPHAEAALGIVPSSDGQGYLFTSFSLYWSMNSSDALLIKIDGQGDTIFTVRQSDANRKYFVSSLVKSHDEGIVICSYVINTLDDNKNYSLIKINVNNEIEFSKTYGDSLNDEQALHVINTNDNGFLIVGQSVFPQNSDAEMYAVKTDSAGNFEWEQYYGGNNFEGAYSAIQTPDSGYLVFGFTQSFGAGQPDWYIVKSDKLGNQQWQRLYEGIAGGDIDIGSGIIKLSDNNYLLSGGGGVYGRLIKINSQGVVIWQKNYTYPGGTGGNFLYWARELTDYSIIAAGGTNKPSESDAGWIIKTDSAGNLLWQRKYNKTNDVELFYDFIPTDDAGFVLCGQARNPQTNNQDAWLLKVDSLGCPYADCTVGIDEADNTKVVADIYPNPASELLNVEFQNVEDWLISLTDVNGKVVYTSNNDKETIITVNVSSFSAGVYLLQLTSEKSFVNKKIIIQH